MLILDTNALSAFADGDPSLAVVRVGAAGGLSQFHLRLPEPRSGGAGLRHHRRKIKAAPGERADLIYSRFSHPNAEILEDQIVPLEAGATDAAVFNTGMAAIMTAFFAVVRPNTPSFTPRRCMAAPRG
jgi:predicted phage tail protein